MPLDRQTQRNEESSGELVLLEPAGETNRLPPCDRNRARVARLRRQTLARLCLIGFFVNCKPSEPFLTKYLREVKGIKSEQLDTQVWPWNTYGSFAFFLPVGVAAEMMGYRVTILAGLIFREMTRIILIYGEGVTWMAAMQVTFAAATCVDTVYFAYVYMAVPYENFQSATSWVHFAFHAGNVVGSSVGEILVRYTDFGQHLEWLFYLSWGFSTVGLVSFVLLPTPIRDAPESIFSLACRVGWRVACGELIENLKDIVVIEWETWWVLAVCAHGIIANYYQNQIYDRDPGGENYGTVEAVMELASAVGSLLPSFCLVLFRKNAIPFTILFISTLQIAALLGSVELRSSVYYSYVCNISYVALHNFAFAAACTTIANHAHNHRYAMLFTSSTFVALGLATIVMQIGSKEDFSADDYYRFSIGVHALVGLGVLGIHVVARNKF